MLVAPHLLVGDVRDGAKPEALLELGDALLRVRLALARAGAELAQLLFQRLQLLAGVLADGLALPRLELLVADCELHDILIANLAVPGPHGHGRSWIIWIDMREHLRMLHGLGDAARSIAVGIRDAGDEPDPLLRRLVCDLGCAEGAVAYDVPELLELLLDEREIVRERAEERCLVADVAAEALLEQRDLSHLLGHHHRDDLAGLRVAVAAAALIQDHGHAILDPRHAVVVEARAVDVQLHRLHSNALRHTGGADGEKPVRACRIDFVQHPREHRAAEILAGHVKAPKQHSQRPVSVKLADARHRLVRHREDLHAQGLYKLRSVHGDVRAALAEPVGQQRLESEGAEGGGGEPEAPDGRLVLAAALRHVRHGNFILARHWTVLPRSLACVTDTSFPAGSTEKRHGFNQCHTILEEVVIGLILGSHFCNPTYCLPEGNYYHAINLRNFDRKSTLSDCFLKNAPPEQRKGLFQKLLINYGRT